MKIGHLVRRTKQPAPVGNPGYYKRELNSSLLIRDAVGLPKRNFLKPSFEEQDPRIVAARCFDRCGVFPINFSFPSRHASELTAGDRPYFLSDTFPGVPHSFNLWNEYLSEYEKSHFALSTKKGGWDTFRHLEIIFSGAIPLMPNLEKSSPFSLAHYPKRLLSSVLQSLIDDGPAIPDHQTQSFMIEWAKRYLTTKATAEYLIELSGFATDRVLFLDKALAVQTDYLSAFSFIGLSEVLGNRLVAAFEPSYLFDDFSGETSRMYGKGFGYSKTIPAVFRSSESLDQDCSDESLVALADTASAIVVGNYDANRDLLGRILRSGIDEKKVACIVGSDLVADSQLLRTARRSDMTFFIREFSP